MIGVVIGFAIALTLFSLLNAVLLRWAAELIAKRSLSFRRGFLISVTAAATGFASELLMRHSFGSSYLSNLGSFSDRLPRVVPLLVFVAIVGTGLATVFQGRMRRNNIGFGKGSAIAAIDGVFLAIVGLIAAFGTMLLLPK